MIWTRWTTVQRTIHDVSQTHWWHQISHLKAVWLKSGRSLTRRSSTGRSSIGLHVRGHALKKEKDTLSNSCSQTVNKRSCSVADLYFQRFILRVTKIDVAVCFSEIIRQSIYPDTVYCVMWLDKGVGHRTLLGCELTVLHIRHILDV